MITLSICIPTYNRASQLEALIFSLLNSQLVDFEVVVVDNQSTDATPQKIDQITDPRFRYVRNQTAIPGISNILRCMTYAQGKYALMCLDKDFVIEPYLGEFIERLKKMPSDVSFGQITYDITSSFDDVFFAQGIESIAAMGYSCHHPSGMFFETNYLGKSQAIQYLLASYPQCPFLPDMLQAHLAILGRGVKVNIPLIKTETLEEAKQVKSFTYAGSNIWFLPHNVMRDTMVFMDDAKQLGLSNVQQKELVLKLFKSNLYNATFRYQTIVKNAPICAHHQMSTQEISNKELIKIAVKYNKTVGGISFLSRMIVNLYWCYGLIRNGRKR